MTPKLTHDDQEFFEERAAIREYDGGQDRKFAELAAKIETRRMIERRKEAKKTDVKN